MQINFVMVADGGLRPSVNHVVFEDDAEAAKLAASKIVAELVSAGYNRFTLFDVSKDTHVNIATFKAFVPEAVVEMKD